MPVIRSHRELMSHMSCLAGALVICGAMSAMAQETTYPRARAPQQKPMSPKPYEQVAVERAFGRDLTRTYQRYLKLRSPRHYKFADYLYEGYENRYRRGIRLAAIVAPIMAVVGGGLGGGLIAGSYNQPAWSDSQILMATFGLMFAFGGGVATLVTLVTGTACLLTAKRKMNRLSRLISHEFPRRAPQFSIRFGPGAALFDIRF